MLSNLIRGIATPNDYRSESGLIPVPADENPSAGLTRRRRHPPVWLRRGFFPVIGLADGLGGLGFGQTRFAGGAVALARCLGGGGDGRGFKWQP